MNDQLNSRLLITGVTAVFSLTLALFIAAGAEMAHATTLIPESAIGQPGVPNVSLQTILLEETVVLGNQELPKVLYIVPWQQPGGIPNITLEHEAPELQVIRRLYPPEYRRELKYYELLQGADTEN